MAGRRYPGPLREGTRLSCGGSEPRMCDLGVDNTSATSPPTSCCVILGLLQSASRVGCQTKEEFP